MAQQNINVGTVANDNTGDTLRGAFVKTEANFTDLYTIVGTPTDANTASSIVKRDANGVFTAGGIGIGGTLSGGVTGEKVYITNASTSTTSATSVYNQYNISAASGAGSYLAANNLAVPTASYAGTGIIVGTQSGVTKQSTGTITEVRAYNSSYTSTGGGNTTNYVHYYATGPTLTSGTISNQFGFYVGTGVSNASTKNYAFYSDVGLNGTINYGFYSNGAAPNYFNGSTLIGSTITQAAKLYVRSDAASMNNILYLQNRNAAATGQGAAIAFSNGAFDLADNRYAYIGAMVSAAGENGNNLIFATNANAASAVERMRIDGAGNVGIGGTPAASEGVSLRKSITGAGSGYALFARNTVAADINGNAYGIATWIGTATSAAPATLSHFYAEQNTLAGTSLGSQFGYNTHPSLIGATNNYAFYAADTAAVTSGKTAYGFYSAVNTATGGGTTYSIYSNGTAPSYFAGNVNTIGVISTQRSGSESSQYMSMKDNDATGGMITSYSAVGNAKPLILNATTTVTNDAVTAGSVYAQIQVRGVARVTATDVGVDIGGDFSIGGRSIISSVLAATTTDLFPASFNGTTLTAYSSSTQTLNCTTTAGSTTVTTTSTAGLRIGALVSVATVQIAANSSVDYNIDGTTFVITPLANLATTAASGDGTTATLTFAARTYAPYAVGATIVVAGVTPAGYNGTYTVTACTTTTVSYLNATTGAQTVAGTIAFTIAAGTSISTQFSQARAALSLDGVSPTVGSRILVKDIATVAGIRTTTGANNAQAANGIYVVTDIGSSTTPWILTRSTDADTITELAGMVANVQSGTSNGGRTFYTNIKSTDTLSTTPCVWYKTLGTLNSTSIANPGSGVGFDFAIGGTTVNLAGGAIADIIPQRISSTTLTASTASLYNRASTLYIQGPPIASDNVTFNAAHSICIGSGNLHTNGTMTMGSIVSAQADFGPILTLGAIVGGGSGHPNNGVYWDVALTSAITGLYALADVTISGGVVTNVALTHGGHRYKAGETLTVSEITFTTTSGSISGTSATLNFTKRGETVPFTVGDLINVTSVIATGAVPTTCYQVTGATVTACTTTSVTYTLASAPTGTFTVTTQGTIDKNTAFTAATLTAATVQGSSLWINKYTSDSLGARIRLEPEDTSSAADQELGAIAFASRDSSSYGSGDLALVRGRAQNTAGGGYIDIWTAQNGAPIEGNTYFGRGAIGLSQYGRIRGATTAYGIQVSGPVDVGVTTAAVSFSSSLSTSSTVNGANVPAYTLTSMYHIFASNITAGNGAIVSGNHGLVAGSSMTTGTLNTGVFSNIPAPTAGVAGPFTISNVSSSGTTVTVTTTVAHGLTNGQTVTIAATANATALVSGIPVTILTVGTTDYTLIGATENTVGHSFNATGAGTGTGTVTLNLQGSGKTVAGSSGSTFTVTGPSATHAAVTVLTGTVTVSTRYNIYAAGTAENYFAGDVGIGTATPAYKLDVVGNTNVTGVLSVNGESISGSSTALGVTIAVAAGMYL